MPRTRADGRYQDIRRLGTGGMGTVTLAQDTKLGRLVALKRVHAIGDQHGLTRLRREALVGASLSHPNLVSVYDVVIEADGDLTIVMEYVAGNTLRDVVGGDGVRPAREALRILEGVASGLDAIHARGVVHRDVKPANVLLGTDGAVKVADLGVAAVAERTQITTAGAVVGTFAYMAPEQLDGRTSEPAADIYALSAVAFEMLCGHKARPELNPLALAHAMSTQPPPDVRDRWPEAPAEAAAVLQRGMALDPARRPRSAGELVRRLGAALEPETTAAHQLAPPVRTRPTKPPPPAPTEPSQGRGRRFGLVAALATVVVAAGALALALGGGGGGKGSPPTAPSSSARTVTTNADATTPAAPPAATTSAPATPAAAVQSFYARAARHDYAGAWSLADANLRSQLAGYASFQSQMSAVRSITFHQAQTLTGASASAATVAVRTTSRLTSGTRQCAGAVRTVRGSGTAWVLDRVSINCTA